jgi:hypothetical protein
VTGESWHLSLPPEAPLNKARDHRKAQAAENDETGNAEIDQDIATVPQPIGGFHLTMSRKPHIRWACAPYLQDNPRQTGFRRPAIDLTDRYDGESLASCTVASQFVGSGMHPHAKKWLTILYSLSIYISQDPRHPADPGL